MPYESDVRHCVRLRVLESQCHNQTQGRGCRQLVHIDSDDVLSENIILGRVDDIGSSCVLAIRLAELRQRQGVRQTQLKAFSQTGVSKLEKRKDMKLSTLIEYLADIGMGLEILVYPKNGKKTQKKLTLLRV